MGYPPALHFFDVEVVHGAILLVLQRHDDLQPGGLARRQDCRQCAKQQADGDEFAGIQPQIDAVERGDGRSILSVDIRQVVCLDYCRELWSLVRRATAFVLEHDDTFP